MIILSTYYLIQDIIAIMVIQKYQYEYTNRYYIRKFISALDLTSLASSLVNRPVQCRT